MGATYCGPRVLCRKQLWSGRTRRTSERVSLGKQFQPELIGPLAGWLGPLVSNSVLPSSIKSSVCCLNKIIHFSTDLSEARPFSNSSESDSTTACSISIPKPVRSHDFWVWTTYPVCKRVAGEQPADTECAFCAYFGHEPCIATKLAYFREL